MASERFVGTVERGKVRLDHVPRWRAAIQRLEGRRIEVTLQQFRQTRSLKANAYLWGVIYPTIAEWSGHDENELHDAMKAMFLPAREVSLPTGEVVMALASTRTLDTLAFSDFVTRVKVWARGQGVEIPEPDDVGDL